LGPEVLVLVLVLMFRVLVLVLVLRSRVLVLVLVLTKKSYLHHCCKRFITCVAKIANEEFNIIRYQISGDCVEKSKQNHHHTSCVVTYKL